MMLSSISLNKSVMKKMIKSVLRYKTEDTNPEEVLNGNIDKFIEAGIFGKNK